MAGKTLPPEDNEVAWFVGHFGRLEPVSEPFPIPDERVLIVDAIDQLRQRDPTLGEQIHYQPEASGVPIPTRVQDSLVRRVK
jgi:hypothetical protein